jgi:hypothetical protein
MTDKINLMFRKWLTKHTQEKVVVPGKRIGEVAHYFKKPSVIEFTLGYGEIVPGNILIIQGNTTEKYEVKVHEVRVDGNLSDKAVQGDLVTIKVPRYTRKNDSVYKKKD